VRRQRLVGVKDHRRRHAVKLAHLRRALQHLKRVGIIRNLKGLRLEDAAATEGARLVARHARLKALRTRLPSNVVDNLLLGRRRNVQEELQSGRKGCEKTIDKCGVGRVRAVCGLSSGGTISMFGVTWYRAMRALAVSTALSKPSCELQRQG